MIVGRTTKMALALAAIAVMMIFSETTPGSLLGSFVGAGLVLLGIVSYYRPACTAGLIIAAGSAAVSSSPGSLTAVASILNGVFGLLIPVFVLAWVSLTSTSEESYQMMLRSRASTYTVVYVLACIMSVPIAVLAIGLFAPEFSTAFSVLTEIALVLTVTTAGLIVLTSPRPAASRTVEPETGSE
jgi:hypothetical protein